MPGQRNGSSTCSVPEDDWRIRGAIPSAVYVVLLLAAVPSAAQQPPSSDDARPAATKPLAAPATAAPARNQAELEAALSKMLSGATLEGSYTSTGGERSPDRLRNDKYTLGEVKKLEGDLWLIQARIQYRDGNAVMIPLPLPIQWAGDTPVIVVDNFTIPGMGTFSARVMFFDDHYVGYWKHDDRGGHLFGLVRRAGVAAPASERPAE